MNLRRPNALAVDQGPTLFSRTFKALNLEKKFKDFQRCVHGTPEFHRLA